MHRICVLLLCAALTFVPGCKSKKQQPSPTNPGEPEPKVSELRIGIFAWVGYTPLYVAKEKGFFKKRGLEVTFVKLEDTAARRMAMASGKVDATVAIVDELAAAAAVGWKVKAFLKIDRSLGSDGVVAKSEIKTIAELKGKTIAFPKGLPSHYLLIHVLKDAGLTMKDITPKYMEAANTGAAFLSGSVDAAVTWEPWLTKAKTSKGGRILATTRDKPGLIVDIMVATPEVVTKRPADLQKVAEAWFEALQYLKKNPNDAKPIMAKSLGVKLDEFDQMLAGVGYSGREENIEYFSTTDGSSKVVKDLVQANKVWMKAGLSKKQITAKEFVFPDVILGMKK